MAIGTEEMFANLSHSQRFFRAHLNGIRQEQWDWKPSPACRSVREILLHWTEMAEMFGVGDGALQTSLKKATPDVSLVQALMKDAGLRFAAGFRAQYADSPMDSLLPNGTAVGSMLAGLPAEDMYHAGQVAYIRLATDPAWDWVKAVHQTPEI